jgi:hypothetical protein
MDPRPRLILAGLLALGLLTALFVPARYSMATLATGPSGPQATATLGPRQSNCSGLVTTTLSTHDLRLCDEAQVAVSAWPSCPTCLGGIHVVFVQVDASDQAAWMNKESVAALRQLQSYRGQEMRVGVVHYNSQSVRQVLPMTDNLSRANDALNAPNAGHDPHGDFVGAARMALDMLQDARKMHEAAGGSSSDKPCEYVIFFASTASVYVADEARILEAGQMISRNGVVLMAGCPETSADSCRATREMPNPRHYYADVTLDAGRLRRYISDEMDKLQEKSGLNRMSMWQTLPPGLQYVDGSASEAPAVTTLPDQSVRLSWDWSRLQRTEPHSVTYRVQPLREGTWTISGLLTLRDKENRLRELVAPELSLTVAGDCSERTPTLPPTATNTPVPTASATPKPRPAYIPVVMNG